MRLAIVVGQHQTLLLGAEGLAALHRALAIRNVGVAIAASGLRRRLSRREHAVLVENAKRDECARRAAVALSRVVDGVARVVRGAARAFAAAWRRGRGRRLGGGDDAVVGVIGNQKAAAHVLAAGAVCGARTFLVCFVAVDVTTANLLGRRGGRWPHCLAILVLAERLKVATWLAIVVGEHQTLVLGSEFLALLHPALAVRNVGVAIAAAGLRRRFGRREHAIDVDNTKCNERARRAAVALIRIRDLVARLIGSAARTFAAARRHCRGRRLRRGDIAITVVVRLHEITALALALLSVAIKAAAFVIRFVAVSVAAARRVRRRRGGGPQHRAVLVLVHRLKHAVIELETFAFSTHRSARRLVFLAVLLIWVDVAAARLLGRRLRQRAIRVGSRDPFHARRRLFALFARVACQAHVLALLRVRFAAALLFGRRRRRGRGHLAIARIIRHQERAAHVLAFALRRRPRAFAVGFVAVAIAAARRLSRRLRRRRPQRLAVHVFVHRLEHAARHSAVVGQEQTVALREIARARVLPALAVCARGVHVAAAGLCGRLGRAKCAFVIHIAVFDKVTARRALALLARQAAVAHVV